MATACQEENPTGCFVDGTIIFKEDFGGNAPNDPMVALYRLPNPSVTNYP
jgi:hypothetical protein